MNQTQPPVSLQRLHDKVNETQTTLRNPARLRRLPPEVPPEPPPEAAEPPKRATPTAAEADLDFGAELLRKLGRLSNATEDPQTGELAPFTATARLVEIARLYPGRPLADIAEAMRRLSELSPDNFASPRSSLWQVTWP